MAEDIKNLERIFDYIDALEKTERTARVRVEPSDIFPPLVFAMILLTLIRMTFRETILRRSP